jgi:hypothetical protein
MRVQELLGGKGEKVHLIKKIFLTANNIANNIVNNFDKNP